MRLRTAVHGMPRIGRERALKWALEAFWAGRATADSLDAQARAVRHDNWQTVTGAGVDFVPSNDFSLYDHVLDAAVALGAIPERFGRGDGPSDLDTYFAMARGADLGRGPVAPLELTKWFDTNYHHLVPELGPDTVWHADATKARTELVESAALGVTTTPVLLGPLTFLLRSAASASGFDRLRALDAVVGVYAEIVAELARHGAAWVRFDEPALVEDRSPDELDALRRAYEWIAATTVRPRIAVATYFGDVGPAMPVLRGLPVDGVGLDLCRGPANVELLRDAGGVGDKVVFAGVVDGRNVWVNDLDASLSVIDRLSDLAGEVVVSTSCSLLHVPLGAASSTQIDDEVRPWLAFTEDKLRELTMLARGAGDGPDAVAAELEANRAVLDARRRSPRVHHAAVRSALASAPVDPRRGSPPAERAASQQARLRLPVLPTTTIGSFPQTKELRAARASWRAGRTGDDEYRAAVRSEIDRAVALQEEIGVDVVVHGEPERDDMVRYFAERLAGFVVPEDGWVQSYGSRCVRPPILFGDVSRPEPMSLEWTQYARSLTAKPVKGMLTGPVTMLRWSFVRDDQPESDTAAQLALALRDELADLQAIGTAVIQVDEPALREGFPLRVAERAAYLAWATRAFRLVTSAANTDTQVHTHMCYAQLGDVVDVLDDLDVDVVSLEAARSKMHLVDDLASSRYQGGVGPGVYDVHSPVVPDTAEIATLLHRALAVLGPGRLWVNPDCGLKTRRYDQVAPALAHMVGAAREVRAAVDARAGTS
jgi:5-methyltetrahydropteroyltriglutamate--homocysteine methyltransferase